MAKQLLSRRRLLGTGAGLAGAMALGGSGRALATPGGMNRQSLQRYQEQITLNVFIHGNHPFDAVQPIYEAKYPNVKLNMMEENDPAIFRATLAANGEGTPDILWPEIDMVQD